MKMDILVKEEFSIQKIERPFGRHFRNCTGRD